jgi:hypothetical protein
MPVRHLGFHLHLHHCLVDFRQLEHLRIHQQRVVEAVDVVEVVEALEVG